MNRKNETELIANDTDNCFHIREAAKCINLTRSDNGDHDTQTAAELMKTTNPDMYYAECYDYVLDVIEMTDEDN